jgi:hypothetical protein
MPLLKSWISGKSPAGLHSLSQEMPAIWSKNYHCLQGTPQIDIILSRLAVMARQMRR